MPGGNFCAECGNRLTVPFAPCERCGAGAGGDSTTFKPIHSGGLQPWEERTTARPFSGEDTLAPPSEPSSSRPSLLVPVVALLALAGLVGGLFVGLGIFGQDDPAGRASAADEAERDDARTARTGGDAGRDGGTPPLRVTCWTGNPAVSERACPAGPSDTRQGFAWVFPRVDFERCDRSSPAGRTMRSCEIDGVRMNFSLWSSVEQARANYVSNFGVEPEVAPAGRVMWDGSGDRFGDGEYKTAVMYADHPWSMTVYASSEQAVSAAVYRYWMRVPGELRGARRP